MSENDIFWTSTGQTCVMWDPQNGFLNFGRVDLSNVYYVGSYTDGFYDNCYGPCRPCRGYVNFLPYDYQMNPFRFVGGPRIGALC